MSRDKWVLEQILYTKLLRINLCLHSVWLWFMEALLMSCSGLGLWLKRLTEINMFLCSSFSKKKMCCICWIIKTGEWRKKIGCGMTAFSVYSGVLPSKEEIPICRDGVISREANRYSSPETLASREPFLPSLPAAARAQSEAARPVQRGAGAACKARINPFRPGSVRRRSKLCTCSREERGLSCFAVASPSLTSCWPLGRFDLGPVPEGI